MGRPDWIADSRHTSRTGNKRVLLSTRTSRYTHLITNICPQAAFCRVFACLYSSNIYSRQYLSRICSVLDYKTAAQVNKSLLSDYYRPGDDKNNPTNDKNDLAVVQYLVFGLFLVPNYPYLPTGSVLPRFCALKQNKYIQ